MSGEATKAQVLVARVAVGLMIVFVVAGVAWHGVSVENVRRVVRNVLERPFGPMTFRFVLQPVMAAIAAWRDGREDARTGRSPYLWAMITRPESLGGRLNEGLISTGRVIILGLVMDTIYQALVFDTFHPVEAVLISLLLAFVPYLLLRGPFARLARWRKGDGVR